MDKLRTTNILLLVIIIPLVFYLLKILSFIFIPLVFSMFIALLFLPIMRWLGKKNIPKLVSIFIVVLLIAGGVKIGVELIQISSREILNSDTEFFTKAEEKIQNLFLIAQETFGFKMDEKEGVFNQFIAKDNIGNTINFIQRTLTMTLMTIFFVVLWLAESINIQKVLHSTILKQRHTSLKTFLKIEKDLIKFIKVKFFVSLATGIGTGLACLFFDVSFPIFWGLFAFIINFVQMVGSVITVVMLSLFAFIELDPSSTLAFFIVSITGVQVLFGSILEPIFMGKSFSLNVITVLVMLMFWGFLWGVPGLIMAIPITVFIKIILDQFPDTKVLSDILSGDSK
ncbi:AI-2E family transporter [Xanthomarina sp. F2636L]|uniref:AI-2E family transporter n=1 Tax=Xanthomarina sp. F2636L TaxID=2996018 RepID=UPI00225E21ED|nr:AI-2E family transporter [Xanthomarina sp. F2636L]MCX7550629.1 AI-2E family transporter [Xanthomarina sp. F2636L]